MKDLIILGNGMAGMTAALYAKRANLDFKIVGKDEFNFGQIGNAILVENFSCMEPISGFDLAMKLHNQLENLNVTIEEHEVQDIQLNYKNNEQYYLICYTDGNKDEAKSIIYALGAMPRQLSCEIEEGIPMHYCALCDGPLYKDKTVAVIGGGDVAFTQAEYLSKICSNVIILMCDENITAAPSTVARVKKCNNIDIYMNTPVKKIGRAANNKIAIFTEQVEKPEFGEPHVQKRVFVIDGGIFVAIGMEPNTQSIISSSLPIITDTFGYIMADENGKTTTPGLFAAGDVRTKQLRQSITAAADGAIAVQSVIDYLKNKE